MRDLNRALGERLRAARRARGWSLLDVEEKSGHEFRASVLGAYERGERNLSVPRLYRLAALYRVSPASLLPTGPDDEDRIVVDIAAAEQISGRRAEVIDRFLQAIHRMRQDGSSPALTVRQSDLKILAGLLAEAGEDSSEAGAGSERVEDG